MSRKILLVYDDYAEMMRVQSDLMKMGFDVTGIMNEAMVQDQLVSFNADLVITAGRGGKVSAPSVAQRLRENTRFNGKVLILLPLSQRPSADELARIRMDALLELPSPMPKIITVIARLLSLDERTLMDKYQRAKAEVRTPEPSRAGDAKPEGKVLTMPTPGSRSESAPAPRARRDRAARFEEAIQSATLNPQQTSFERKELKERQEKMKKDWDFRKLASLDELKRRFVSALFKK